MRCHPCWIALLLSCVLPGCITANSFLIQPEGRVTDAAVNQDASREVNWDDPVEHQQALATIDHQVMREEIAKIRSGSHVRVGAFGNQYTGTVVQADRTGVKLTNCLCKEVVPGPDGQKQLKTSHIPLLTFKIANMTRFDALSAPPRGAAKSAPNSEPLIVDAVMLKSGRRQACAMPTEQEDPGHGIRTSEEVREEILRTPCGSQVSIVNELGHRYNATFLSASPEGVELISCVWTETIPGRNSHGQFKVSHLPWQSFPLESIKSFEVLFPPSHDFVPSELGEDRREYTFDAFVDASGRDQHWGEPPRPSRQATDR